MPRPPVTYDSEHVLRLLFPSKGALGSTEELFTPGEGQPFDDTVENVAADETDSDTTGNVRLSWDICVR